ncbi:SUMO-specific isopeptidase USPL1 isoform X2 [Acanthochromis polyacanthus]|uniref:SUMO-specific isopeptidase USPL1 isoform X2 n=1 Tax=Acanthochromis polyacanthus TaxID=80966 RepID=UPI000B900FBC|nr:SUMO-specific isopeptidase USPL1 isoform X2 [Acanthochromis polyacanthus]
MVIFSEWHRTVMDPKSSSCLPMTGEDTGLGALASPLAGYLGKVQERAASLEHCPWCTSKGLTFALRSYRINLQESITLCTNPQCLFPLVTQSLEDVLASLDPVEPAAGNKRKNASSLETEELIKPSVKRLRSSEPQDLGPQSIADTPVNPAERGTVNTVTNGQHAAPKADGEQVNGYHKECPLAETTGCESLQGKDVALEKNPDGGADGLAPPTWSASVGHTSDVLLTADGSDPALSPHCGALGKSESDLRQGRSPPEVLNRCSRLSSNQSNLTNGDICCTDLSVPSMQHSDTWTEDKSPAVDITGCKYTGSIKSKSEDLSFTSVTESEELVSVPKQLFWRNSDSLCWLDSLLAALVTCRSLRKRKPKSEPQRSTVWRLMREYDDICAAVQVHQQTGKDGVVMVPMHVLQKASADLQRLRMSIFKLLQPKLHCKLGQRETPVFAMPLLLTMDSWVERLFQSTFQWEFQCSECKTATKERVTKTLPTFTNIVPDWRPLRAVHLGPCNFCCKKNQMRTMMLENVPPVFALHFVEGLPDNDVSIYDFTFKEKRYSITAVIQYNHQLKHFVTWICNADGSWLEYDDLKHPDCKIHQTLQVPAHEMHVVFWETEDNKGPCASSPSSTFAESPPSENERIPSLNGGDLTADELSPRATDHSLLLPHNDTDIVSALTLSADGSSIMDTTVTASNDTSIGATTLLDAFEGLTHNDIITLTLVEVKEESETQPVNDIQQTEDLSVSRRTEMLDPTPDSSSTAVGSEMSPMPDVEQSTASSEMESADDSASDPTFVPGARRVQAKRVGRGKAVSQKAKKAPSSKAAQVTSLPAFPEPIKVEDDKPVSPAPQENTPPGETPQHASPVSSTDTSSVSTGQKSTTSTDSNACWSFLLGKHPVNQLHKSTAKFARGHTPASIAQGNPSPPVHSTPNPLKKLQITAGLSSKAQLKLENSKECLPMKAAEMYGAFNAQSSPLPSPALPTPKLLEPITSSRLTKTTVTSGTSLTVPQTSGLTDISALKKHGSQSSKVPPGLSSTEALRYKLMKKLKAKKKKLAKLNKLLGEQEGAGLRPDSTDLHSPSTVTSSTYDGSTCDDFLSDLLSPATTASHLSPDSTGFLEMLANGQDGADCAVGAGAVSQNNDDTNGVATENFLDEFLLQAVTERPTDMETEALSALELFI